MESICEVGDRIELKRQYIDSINFGILIPAGEFILLIDGPYKSTSANSVVFSWKVLAPCGRLIKMAERDFLI